MCWVQESVLEISYLGNIMLRVDTTLHDWYSTKIMSQEWDLFGIGVMFDDRA